MARLSVINPGALAINASGSDTDPMTPSAVVTGSQSGDLLICIVSIRASDGLPNPALGWIEDSVNRAFSSNTDMYTTVYYQYLTGALTGAQTLDSTARHQWQVSAFLVRGATGVYAVDVVDWHLNADELTDGDYPYTTSSFNTSTDYQLLLTAAHDAEGSELSPTTLGMSGSGVSLTTAGFSATSTDGFGSYDNATAGYGTVAASGTAVTMTVSGGNNGSYAQAGIICLQSAAPSTETGAGGMTLSGIAFSGAATHEQIDSAAMALSGIAIQATAFDLTAEGSVQFSTFGA